MLFQAGGKKGGTSHPSIRQDCLHFPEGFNVKQSCMEGERGSGPRGGAYQVKQSMCVDPLVVRQQLHNCNGK